MNTETEKKFAAGLSIVSNSVIILLKLSAGFISGSISIISEAIHSFADLFASMLTFFAVSQSGKPADNDHPFGHGKYEDLAGFIEGILITSAGLFIIYEAFKKLFEGIKGTSQTEPIIGIYVMLFAVIANIFVSNYLLQVAKKTDSISLYADAKHLRTDIFSSFGVLLGLVIMKFTNITVIDPVIALFVSAIIIKAGYSIVKETINNLLDGTLPDSDINKIKRILNNNQRIKGFKNLKARKAGRYRDIEVTLLFNPDLRITECHNICDEIETEIKKELEKVTIIIHPEPEKEVSILT